MVPAKKSASKKAPSKSSTTKKSAAKETSAASKTPAKKSPAQKTLAKKSAAGGSAKTFKPGDKVAWDTSQGETHGKVVKTQTTPTKIKTHKVAASKDNPQYIVESAKSGKRAAHKPDELRKKS